MNTILIQAATLVDPSSKYHLKTVSVLLDNGKIGALSDKKIEPPKNAQVMDAKGQFLSPGFFDLNTSFGEPGFETRETLATGTAAAAAGGYTGLLLMPDTDPAIHKGSQVAYIMKRTQGELVDVLPAGTISQQREGKELAELYDMYQNGARAFTDAQRPVADAGLMSRALLYSKGFDGIVFSYAEDRSIAGSSKMHEGAMSTILGMKGIPALAEELMVSRDLHLAEYNDAPLHFSTLSTAGSIALIRQAKKRGLKVTCDVAAHHLLLTDEDLAGFDSNYKVKPPLRTKNDVKALLGGLKDGTIDAIVSQHRPLEVEFKNVEFETASYGITGLQTVLPMLVKAGLSVETIADKLVVGPRKVLGLAVPKIESGQQANLVLFDTQASWTLNEQSNRSRSVNSPFFGQNLKGKINLVVNNKQTYTNSLNG